MDSSYKVVSKSWFVAQFRLESIGLPQQQYAGQSFSYHRCHERDGRLDDPDAGLLA